MTSSSTGSSDLAVHGDAERLEQALQNLAANAFGIHLTAGGSS